MTTPRQAVLRVAARVQAGASPEAARAALEAALEEAPALESATVVDAGGNVSIAVVRSGTGARASDWVGLDLSRRPFYAPARAASGPTWSDTFLSPLTGRTTAVIAVPAGGNMIVGDLSLDGLAQQIRLPAGGGELAVIVFDGRGRVIVHPQQQLVGWQENLSQKRVVRAALSGHSGSGDIAIDGRRWLATVAPAATTGWYVLVAQPRNAIFAPVERLASVVGVAVLVVLALVVAVALRLADRQGARYRQLVGAAADLVDDRPGEPRLDLDNEEVHALWIQLRRLLDRSKSQERAARRAQAELQAVLDASTEVAIIAVDARHVIRLFNRGAEKMLGYRADELIDRECPRRLHDPQEIERRGEELSRQLGRPISGGQAITAVAARLGYEVRDWTYVRKDGSRLGVSLAVTAVKGQFPGKAQPLDGLDDVGVTMPADDAEAADAPGYLFIATDQSERERAAELELARRRAEAANQAKSEFLSRVSHELRTPMNAMLGYAQLLQLEDAHRLDDFQRDRVARIEAAGWHLVTLINDVLDLSTIESGNARIRMADIDVGGVITQAQRLVAPLADKAGVVLDVALPDADADGDGDGDGDAWRVQADETRLRQVLVNVLGNAVKYNRDGGRVEVGVRAVDGDTGTLAIEVADTGRGMTEQQLSRLFSAFDRLGLEASTIEGTGIGLVISRRLLERMGGDIAVDSRPGAGTRVTLTLRRADGVVRDAAGHEGLPAAARRAGGHIVYVEDNPVNALLMQEVIAQRPDCTLHLATGVADGIALIEKLRPGLVLIDLHLPDGSGLDVARWMRAAPAFARVPVVVVSADSTQAQRDAADAAGIRTYLAKPINLAQSLATIDELLPPAGGPG